jgi:hypothetical protein
MANFPTTLPSFSNPTANDYLNSPAHATEHSSNNDETVAVATKIGTGASTPVASTYLHGTGTGTSSWDAIAVTTLYRGFGFAIPGTLYVANDLSWDPVSPEAVTAVKIWAHVKTAPTVANLIAQVYNITQSHVVATITITAAGTDANSTSMTNAAIAAGDVLRLDVTQIGSTVAGSDLSVILEATQP